MQGRYLNVNLLKNTELQPHGGMLCVYVCVCVLVYLFIYLAVLSLSRDVWDLFP